MIILAVILLAYILEPVFSARVDQVEIDSIADTPELPDFRVLIEEEVTPAEQTKEEGTRAVQEAEPAKHRP